MSLASNEVQGKGDSTSLVSNWYKFSCRGECPSRWSEFKHRVDESNALLERTASVPIIHRHIAKDGKWVTHNITVQDVSMRKVLDEVLGDYQNLDLQAQEYTFTAPFMPLCHRWESLKQFPQQAEDPALKHAASKLLDFLTPMVASKVASLVTIRETGRIASDDIWQIFAPKTIVSTEFYGVKTTCRVKEYQGTGMGWKISMEFIDWNGERSGFSNTSTIISAYNGYRRISSLPVFPISFLEDEASYKASMIERGRIFEQIRGYHFMDVNGVKISIDGKEPVQRPIAGRVCIDACAYYTSCDIVKPYLKPLPQTEDNQDTKAEDTTEDSDNEDDDEYDSDSSAPRDSRFTAIKVENDTTDKRPMERVENLAPLTDEQCLLATPWVKGFDLKSKQWYELRVDELRPITWNDEAFDKLILPGDEKHLAWEFVEAKSLVQREEFDDFITDKGRGLIMLMFGPPGVGKTLTAEAVADKSRVPLYTMSASELGTKPNTVEKALERVLNLCSMWNAILLLDEADVFLGARTSDSIERNELVAIFLRMLEYYKGTMFLTTNRIASIDPAFQSRIDLFLPYHDLTSEARRKVWCNFIERAGQDKFEVTGESLDKLSQLPLNGREIKNLIKSVQLLSIKRGCKISMDRVQLLAERRVEALTQASGSPQ
ncbi:P-loop containing nucleoside triphosphate hydrolase protein [Xylaria curta]|nr:P-loop containing nucleoside triphosphate hydrolase protein [Xylaria curta]